MLNFLEVSACGISYSYENLFYKGKPFRVCKDGEYRGCLLELNHTEDNPRFFEYKLSDTAHALTMGLLPYLDNRFIPSIIASAALYGISSALELALLQFKKELFEPNYLGWLVSQYDFIPITMFNCSKEEDIIEGFSRAGYNLFRDTEHNRNNTYEGVPYFKKKNASTMIYCGSTLNFKNIKNYNNILSGYRVINKTTQL